MSASITDEDLNECIEEIEGLCGIVFTPEQLTLLLTDEEDLVDDIAEWGVEDTETSGQLASVVSNHILSRSWPLYGDSVDINAFLSDLCKAAESKGYLVKPQQS